MLPLLLGCLLEKLSHITYSGQLAAMSNHIIADLILFSVSLASMAGLLADAFLHQRLLELPVYGVLLLLDVSLIALETQLASGKGGRTSGLPSQQYANGGQRNGNSAGMHVQEEEDLTANRQVIAGIPFFVRPDNVKQVERRDGAPSEEAKMQSDYDEFRPRLLEGNTAILST